MFWPVFVSLCNSVGKAPNVVANEVGVKSSGTVTGWSKGAQPRQGVLLKLADYFGVSVEYLQGEDEKKPATDGSGLSPELAELFKEMSDLTPGEAAYMLEQAKRLKSLRNK